MTWARVIDKNHKHLIFYGPNVLHDKLSQHIKEQLTFQSTQTLADARSEWAPEPLRWKNFDLKHNYPNKSIRYAVNTICIMCESGFIPVFMRCPRDLKMLRWHFSGSFVHTCQGEMWREIRDGSCSCGFCLGRVHQHWPWPCRCTVQIGPGTHALARPYFLLQKEKKKKKSDESLALCRRD